MITTIAVVTAAVLVAAIAIKLFGVVARIAVVLVAAACIVVWVEPELAARAMTVAKHKVVQVVPEARAWLP